MRSGNEIDNCAMISDQLRTVNFVPWVMSACASQRSFISASSCGKTVVVFVTFHSDASRTLWTPAPDASSLVLYGHSNKGSLGRY
jgi:hypothetical protein